MSERISQYLVGVLNEVAKGAVGESTLALLAEILGLCQEAGEEMDHAARDRAAEKLKSVSTAEMVRLIELVTARFHLMNIGEQLNIVRVNHEREFSATREAPRTESIAEAAVMALRDGVTAQGFVDALQRVDVGPTLTAHPTEARRRTVIMKQLEIARCARQLHEERCTPGEREELEEQIRAGVALLLMSDDVRARRLTVDDEARNGLFFLTHSIWEAVPRLSHDVAAAARATFGIDDVRKLNPLMLTYRSWIGGDRDGNPLVTHETTKATLRLMREAAFELWEEELTGLGQDLSISTRRAAAPAELIEAVEQDREKWLAGSHAAAHRGFEPLRLRIIEMRARLKGDASYTSALLVKDLEMLRRAMIATESPWLRAYRPLEDAIVRAKVFGLHLATVDIRQHSSVHERAVSELLALAGVTDSYAGLSEEARLEILRKELQTRRPLAASDATLTDQTREVLETLNVVREAIASEPASVRSYVISMTHGVSDVLEVLLLMKERGLFYAGAGGGRTLHVVPLLETIEDLEIGPELLKALFADPVYRGHLENLAKQESAEHQTPPGPAVQEIMLGYSDSNKDGGFFMANVALHDAQERLGAVARDAGVHVKFFHGRGGTVGRGGGRAGRAILAAPEAARSGQLRFTEQGEVISFRYAMPEIAHRHLEQILNAAIRTAMPRSAANRAEERATGGEFGKLLSKLARVSMQRYREFIQDPRFWAWFVGASPIRHIGSLPIASRPVARGSADSGFAFDQLRAIPWVFSWIQMRALAPGWFGLGTALAACTKGEMELLQREAEGNAFLETIFDNALQEMARARMQIVKRYAALGPNGDAMFAALNAEFDAAKNALLSITGRRTLLEHSPVIAASIAVRNPWTDVLNLIQIELLNRFATASEAERPALQGAVLASINGVAAAMQSTG